MYAAVYVVGVRGGPNSTYVAVVDFSEHVEAQVLCCSSGPRVHGLQCGAIKPPGGTTYHASLRPVAKHL